MVDVLRQIDGHLGGVAVEGDPVGAVHHDVAQPLGRFAAIGPGGEGGENLSGDELDEQLAVEGLVGHASLLA